MKRGTILRILEVSLHVGAEGFQNGPDAHASVLCGRKRKHHPGGYLSIGQGGIS